jgi:hypothetical protein
MSTTAGHRLVSQEQFLAAWRKAHSHSMAGRTVRARSLWARACRAARALHAVRRLQCALERTMRDGSATSMEPAVTPVIARSRRTGGAPRLSVASSAGRLSLDRRAVEGIARTGSFTVIVDCTRQRVMVGGRELPLEGRDTPLMILASLMRSGGGPMTLAQLFPQVWGRPLNPAYDPNTVYFHVSRLRKLLTSVSGGREIMVTTAEGYMLAPGVRYALIASGRTRRPVGRERSGILAVLADRRFVDNRSYCEITGVSRSTALRELADLVREGILLREGAGRGVRYRMSERSELATVAAPEPPAPTDSPDAPPPVPLYSPA